MAAAAVCNTVEERDKQTAPELQDMELAAMVFFTSIVPVKKTLEIRTDLLLYGFPACLIL